MKVKPLFWKKLAAAREGEAAERKMRADSRAAAASCATTAFPAHNTCPLGLLLNRAPPQLRAADLSAAHRGPPATSHNP